MNAGTVKKLSVWISLIIVAAFGLGVTGALAQPAMKSVDKNSTETGIHPGQANPEKRAVLELAKKKTLPLVGWSSEEPNGCEINEVDSYPSGTSAVYVDFKVNELVSAGDEIKYYWFVDDEQINAEKYEVAEEDECIWLSLYMKKEGDTLPEGSYRIELKLGKTLIGEAETEVGGEGDGGDGGKKPDNGGADDGPSVWTDKRDKNNCPVNAVDQYPSGTEEIHATFGNAPDLFEDSETYNDKWFMDDEVTAKGKFNYLEEFECYDISLSNGGEALPDATYRLEVYQGSKLITQSEVEIGGDGGDGKQTFEGVYIQGTITDADTGKAIKGATVSLLKPGVTFKSWKKDKFPEADIFSMTETDKKGFFRMEDGMERGETYVIAAVNDGYGITYGDVEVAEDAKDVIEMDLELQSE